MNCAKNGSYANSIDQSVDQICAPLHATFEAHRHEKWAAQVMLQNARLTATSIVNAKSLLAFAGRCMIACATRGGRVFELMVEMLCDGRRHIPLRVGKLSAVLLGCLDDDKEQILFGGQPWVHCAVGQAEHIHEQLGDALFKEIELKMHSSNVGWVYRESDIPNRHGHCNSNPNSHNSNL